MTEPGRIPTPPPLPPVRQSNYDVLADILAVEEDEYREKRFQKDLQFRMVGAIEKKDYTLLEELIDAGVNTNATIMLVKTPLIHALDGLTLNKGCLSILLSAKTETDPNLAEKTPWGLKPLHYIAKQGLVEVAQLFLESPRGSMCDVNGRDNGEATPLHFAIFHGHDDMVQYLISKGADIFAVDNVGRSTLHRACETQNFKMAELLLEKGISIDVCDKFGWTPLFHSVFFGHTLMVRFLIDRGANVECKDIYDESLIQVMCVLQYVTVPEERHPVAISIDTSFNFYERSRSIPSQALRIHMFNVEFYDILARDEHLNMLKLLVNTGIDANSYPVDRFISEDDDDLAKPAKAYMLLAGAALRPTDQWVRQDSPWRDWFTTQLEKQYSLKHQCRRRIRSLLKQTRNINSAVGKLPLPRPLKLYLKLNDIQLFPPSRSIGENFS